MIGSPAVVFGMVAAGAEVEVMAAAAAAPSIAPKDTAKAQTRRPCMPSRNSSSSSSAAVGHPTGAKASRNVAAKAKARDGDQDDVEAGENRQCDGSVPPCR
jgi:hypothetical protein